MTKKSKTIFIIVSIFLVIFIILRMEEDGWICSDGQWEKHGFPHAPMPEGWCAWLDTLNPF